MKFKSANVLKDASIDELSSHFLRDGSRVLSKPISELCNLSIKLRSFLDSCQIGNLEHLFKTGPKLTPQFTGLYPYYL